MAEFQKNHTIVLVLCFGLLATLGRCYLPELEGTKLRLVSAVFRHGDRTVDVTNYESYPNDPYKSLDFYPNDNGLLTNNGKKKVYQLGEKLRRRYDSFLGKVYYYRNVYAQSSSIVRTKLSLQLVLAALYPPIDIQKWNPLLSWQPTEFTYTSADEDNLFFAVMCSTYFQLYNDMIQNDQAVKNKIAEYADFMKELSIYTGKNITTMYDLMLLYGTLTAESSMGLSLPKWTKDIFPNGKLADAVASQLDMFSYGVLNRLNGGVLLRTIINDMNETINGTLKDRKINLYSGHDINVSAVLHALNIFDYRVPQYTSSVIIELHEKNGEFFVKVVYYLGSPSKIVEKNIPGCEILCPYNKFIELLSLSIATNEELKCSEKIIPFMNY